MTKQKKQTKSKTAKHRSKHHPPEYLAVVLLLVLVSEGLLFGLTSVGDWQQGAALLDMSPVVMETSQNLVLAVQPMITVTEAINEFYQRAATEMAVLLDLSHPNVTDGVVFVYNSVYNFYQEASTQMASLLGIPNVALASIGN